MATITKRVTVELTADAGFFQNWLEDNVLYTYLAGALVEQFKMHLEYQINARDKLDVPYSATITEVQQ